jgi:hypothetical protein
MKLKHLTTAAMALILMSACTEGAGVGLEPDELAGTWVASAMVFTSVADNTVSVDIVADESAVVTLTLGEDGSYSFSFVSSVETDEESGTYAVSGSTLTVTPTVPDGLDAESMTISRDGDNMTLTLADTFDFVDDQEEDATLVITLAR